MPCLLTLSLMTVIVLAAMLGYIIMWGLLVATVTLLAMMICQRHDTYEWHEYGLLGNGKPHPNELVRDMKRQQWLALRHYEQNGLA